MITEDYVSFEIAKLLKEKGFDVHVSSFYDDEGKFSRKEADWNWNIGPRYSVPTLQMAMKWLREIHNLYIVITPAMLRGRYNISIYKKDNIYPRGFDGDSLLPSYEQACEAAIRYCLENLI